MTTVTENRRAYIQALKTTKRPQCQGDLIVGDQPDGPVCAIGLAAVELCGFTEEPRDAGCIYDAVGEALGIPQDSGSGVSIVQLYEWNDGGVRADDESISFPEIAARL